MYGVNEEGLFRGLLKRGGFVQISVIEQKEMEYESKECVVVIYVVR
jgi:hypothetical protein